MRLITSFLCLLVVLHCSYAPPVSPNKDKENDSEVKDDLEEYMEYHRYLREVVQALESDPEFRERLEKADEEDVRSGKIAEQLDFVNHNVRTHLDEIKRRELERLRHLATKEYELTNHIDQERPHAAINDHLDHQNVNTFEIEDLRKLIRKTTSDLEEADKKRKDEFKEYEMKKEFDKHQKLETLDETQKKEFQQKLDQEEDAKKHHKPLHHPVTKEQLVELWKKADELEARDFNPRVFFMMHDVDGNGVWDADEVKALFIKELDKMYGPEGPNKDLHERAEEMERMREHVFKESDLNRDGLIDFNEFIDQTKRAEFQQDQGWQPIDDNQVYSQQEYQEFEKKRMDEMRYLQQLGLVDAHGNPLPGAQNQIRQAIHQRNQQLAYQNHQPQQYGGHPAQYQQMPVQGQMPHVQGQVPPIQGQLLTANNQVPQVQQYQPNVGYQGQPPLQYQPHQAQYQQPQGQVPQQQYQQQQGQAPPPQYHQQQGQVPAQIIPVQQAAKAVPVAQAPAQPNQGPSGDLIPNQGQPAAINQVPQQQPPVGLPSKQAPPLDQHPSLNART